MANTATAFPLGYYSGNPNGNSATAEAQWQSQYNNFVQAMGGSRPQFMDSFVDYTQDPSAWGANQSWAAWSWAQSGNNYVGPGSGTTPVIGVPMYSTVNGWPGSGGEDVDTFYQQIISGQYDADYKSVVDAWAGEGYKTMYLRIAYEFDGNFMSWSPGNSSSPNADADFVKAWQHIANLVHAEGQADGVTVKTVWNPDEINWTYTSPTNLYPGNQYVDVISADVYSPVYPVDLTDWASGGTTQDSSLTQWASSAANREHFWQYPDADQYALTGNGSGWSLQDTINFAKQEGKPLGISETGAGGNGTTTGPLDDPAFPQWLAGELHQAVSEGVPVSFVNVWDASVSDGDWDFSDPGAGKPQEEAAWDQYFGAGSGSSTTTGGGSGSTGSSGGGSSSGSGSGGSTGGGSSGSGKTTGATVGSGADKLVLDISEDRYANGDGTSDANGDSTFIVLVDGKQIGGTLTATAMHSLGQTEQFTVEGNFGPGTHLVGVELTNNAWSGVESPTTDRNIYIDSATYDGATVPNATGADYNGGGVWFNVSGGTPAPQTTSTITTTSGRSTTVAIVGNTASVTANSSTTQDNLSGGVTINANGLDKISIDHTSSLNVTVNGGASRLTVSDAGTGDLTFNAGSGNVTLVGGSGTNDIALGACSGGTIFFDGNMSVTGGSGPFNWEFTKGDVGNDVIPYKIGHDTIVLNGYGTNSSAAITSNTSSGGSTTLVLSDNTHITLTGVAHISDSSIVLH